MLTSVPDLLLPQSIRIHLPNKERRNPACKCIPAIYACIHPTMPKNSNNHHAGATIIAHPSYPPKITIYKEDVDQWISIECISVPDYLKLTAYFYIPSSF